MKAPKGLLDREGRAGKLTAFLRVDEEKLQEYAYPDPDSLFTETGTITSACYVLTSPGDVIHIAIAANQGTADIIDCYIDGILRASNTVPKSLRVSNLTIKRVVYREWDSKNSKRKKPQMGELLVKERDTSRDIRVSRDENTTSAVSTIILKCWRKDHLLAGVPHPRASVSNGENPNPISSPNYETHPDWFALNKNIPEEGLPPPFEFGFINPTKPHKTKERNGPQERVDEVANRNPLEHTLYAEFHFHLRSTADLRVLGFEDVPIHYSTGPPSPKPKRRASKTGKAKEEREPEPELRKVAQLGTQSQAHLDDHASKRPPDTMLLENSMSATEDVGSVLAKSPKNSRQAAEYRPRTTLDDLFPDPPQIRDELGIRNTSPAVDEIENDSTVIEDNKRIDREDLIPPNSKVSMPTDETLSTNPTKISERGPCIEYLHTWAKITPPRPFVAGLKQAPAYKAWVERGPAKEDSDPQNDQIIDSHSQIDLGGYVQRNNHHHSSRFANSGAFSASDDHQDEQAPAHADWESPNSSDDENESNVDDSGSVPRGRRSLSAPLALDFDEGSNGEDEVDRHTCNGDLRFRFKRSPTHDSQPFADSIQLAPEDEGQEMVKGSKREYFQTPEKSFNYSRRGTINHSKPSPILGGSFSIDVPRSPSISSLSGAPDILFKAQKFQLGTGISLTNSQSDPGSPPHHRTRSLNPSESAAAWREEHLSVRAVRSISPSTFALASRDNHGVGYSGPAEASTRHNRRSKPRAGNLVAKPSRRAGIVPLSRGPVPHSTAIFDNLGRLKQKAAFVGSSLDQSIENFASRLSGNASFENMSKKQEEYPMEGASSQRTPKLELSSQEQMGSTLNIDIITDKNIVLLVTSELTPPKSLSEQPIVVPAMVASNTNETPFLQATLPISQPPPLPSLLNQRRKVDVADTPLFGVDEPARKASKLPHQRKTVESVSNKLQDVTATKRKAEDMTDSDSELKHLIPSKMSTSDLAKKSFKNATAELDRIQSSTSQDPRIFFQRKNPPPIPSKKNAIRQAQKTTPDRVESTLHMTPEEITMKRKTIQERIAAAAKQKEALRKELKGAQTLKAQLKEIHEMENAAEESERENAEIQAQIEAIYGAVNDV